MPSVPREGKKGLYVELPEAMIADLKEFAERAGTGIAFEVRDAIRRHLAFPPKREPEPLPDGERAAESAKKGRAKKG